MTLRPMLATLPAYVPGRSVPGAIKLASNETPYPPLPSVVARIAEAAADVNRYPDSFATELTAALAAKYGVDAEQVRVGCGSVSLCTQLVQAVADADEEVLYAWRSFEAYPIITTVSGASSIQVPLTDGHVHDLDAMAERVTGKTRLIFVCNPNNPTGTAVGRDALVRFLQAVPQDVVVALDEAYREFVTDPDVPDGLTLLDDFPNVVVLRTFSKAYGLAGLRVGFGVAALELAALFLRLKPTWNLGPLQTAGAAAALGDDAHVERTVRMIAEMRSYLFQHLGRFTKVSAVPGARSNFFLLRVDDPALDSTLVFEHLLSRGVIAKDCSVSFRGLGKRYLRVDISLKENMDRLLDALESL
jgi:histidinol-phosphate aminotransferase